jgi:predicted nucleic acid-binding protein
MIKVLIDTDVILDFFFDRKPFSDEASVILSLCEQGEIQGFVTPVLISNVYYLLRKTATHEKVIANLKKLLSIIEICNIDKGVVLQALQSEFNNFEVALQNFSARNQAEIKLIITRNTKDYKTSLLSILTPNAYLKALEIYKDSQ